MIPARALDCISFVMSLEGGYVFDRNDPGGETKYGISKRSYPNLDIGLLTSAQAQLIYYNDYWSKVSGDLLPKPLDLYVFDAAVNQGVGTAIEMLQTTCKTQVDGKIGPQTLAAASKLLPPQQYLSARAMRYSKVPQAQFQRYGMGWFNRLFQLCLY